MSKRTIEIRAAEGGEDARLFAAELANAYLRMAERLGWRAQADRKPDTRSGNQTLSLEVEGRGVEALDTETGGHRVQRVPRSERNGRVHSSTVAVLVAQDTANASDSAWTRRAPGDFSLEWRSGTGCGGQHRNKHMNSARLVHLPTGTTRSAQTRSRENSLQSAMDAMTQELDRQHVLAGGIAINSERKGQVGTGERSDKRRTYRFQEGRVHDHASGRSASTDKVMAGDFGLLWA